MDVEQHTVPYNNHQVEGDYLDRLKPGYRFRPTDAEIIVYYLKRKIETGQHPQCRLYEVNINDHDPQELADRHRACDGKWYFLTPRERKYLNGNQPNRRIKNGGCWRTTQKDRGVYDGGRLVGRKRSFVHYDDNGKKSHWLMHEYITNDPNLPAGTNGKKLSDCVLCKIYKKETNRTHNTNHVEQVENTRNQDEQNQLHDEPSPRRRRLSESNQANEHGRVQYQEENHLLETDVQMAAPMWVMLNSNQESVHNIDTTSGLTAPMGYAQSLQDQTISTMVVQEDNLSFDTTSVLTAPMGYAQSFQDETLSMVVQEDSLIFDTTSELTAPMGYTQSFQDETLSMVVQEDNLNFDTTSGLTAPMRYARSFQDQTISMVVQEDNLSFDTTSGLTAPTGYVQFYQDQSNQLIEHEHVQLHEENYHLGNDVQIVSPMQFMLDSNQEYLVIEDNLSFSVEELLTSTSNEDVRTMDSSDFFSVDEFLELYGKQSYQCSINSTDADQQATRPSIVM